MNPNDTNNVKDLIIRYISERNDLTESETDRVESSTRNKQDADMLQSDLNSLSKLAEGFSPAPLTAIQIPERKPLTFSYMAPALACGLALMFIFFTYTLYTPAGSSGRMTIETVYQEIESDERFMNEVNALVEDVAYSDFYPETTAVESRYDFSDDFIEVIVPI